jgi:starch synthase
VKILFASSEVAPFIKTGGLADVAGSLPAALAKQGHDVRVILPLYEKIAPSWREQMTFLRYFYVPLAWRSLYCGVFQLERDGVTYWFVDNEYYFKRADLYGHYDDAERFGFFSRAVIETPCQLNWKPDVIHCNDWQTALIPIYLLDVSRVAPYLSGVKTVFTIHNIEYQGRYGQETLEDVFGLDRSYLHERLLSYYGDVDLMKGAIYAADFVTTVSPTYAQELHYPFYAHGLDGVIADNSYKLRGILNGIDTDLYDPWKTRGLAQNYSARQPQGKRTCKADLQREVDLKVDPHVPIVACVSRLVSHKGFDLVAASLPEILGMDLQMVVLGTGDWRYEEAFRQAQRQYPGRFSAQLYYSAELSNTIYAGADLFLMPSVAEPCGLSQMIAMRYGTIPVVRETGGLRDTVTPFDPSRGTGTGFSFADINAHDMCWVLREAVELYRSNRPAWKVLMHNAMTADFGWDRSAREYIEIYQQITGGIEE